MTDNGTTAIDVEWAPLTEFAYWPGDWVARAACTSVDPDLFFPPPASPKVTAAAREVCRGCPVQVQCVDFAIRADTGGRPLHGIWGGLTHDQRTRLRRDKRS